jgi:serine phosphatase RsbU (regulator of sigma subunit)/serine/threonine protein kinase
MRRTRADIQPLPSAVSEEDLQELFRQNSEPGMTVFLRQQEVPETMVETRNQLAALLAKHPEKKHVYAIDAEIPEQSRGLNHIQFGEDARNGDPVVVRIQHTDAVDSDTGALNETYKAISEAHPNLVTLLQAGWSHDADYSRMVAAVERLPDSPRLSEVMRDIPLMEYLTYVQQALDGIATLHEHQLTYRDLDTGNILMVDDDGTQRVVLHDIDLIGRNKKGKGTLQGKHESMPPELVNPTGYPEGQQWISGWTDMYAARLLIAEKLGFKEAEANDPLPLTGHYTPLAHQLHTLYLACGAIDPPLRPTAKELHEAMDLIKNMLPEDVQHTEDAAAHANELWAALLKKERKGTMSHGDIQEVFDAFSDLRDTPQSETGALHAVLGSLHLMHAELDSTRTENALEATTHYQTALAFDPYNMETHVRRLYKSADIRDEEGERAQWGDVLDHIRYDDRTLDELRNKILKDHPILSALKDVFENGIPEEGLPENLKGLLQDTDDITHLQLRTILMHYIETSSTAAENESVSFADTLRMSDIAIQVDGSNLPARFWSLRAIALSEHAENTGDQLNVQEVVQCLQHAILLNPSASQLRDHAIHFCNTHGLTDDVRRIILKTPEERRSAFAWRTLSKMTDDDTSDEMLRNSLLLDTTNPETNLRCAERIITARPIDLEGLHLHLSRVFCCSDEASEFLHQHYQTLLSDEVIKTVDRKKLFSIFVLWKEGSDDGAHEPYLAACRALEHYDEYQSAVKELSAQYPRLMQTGGNLTQQSAIDTSGSTDPSFTTSNEHARQTYNSTIVRAGSYPVRFPSSIPNSVRTLQNIPQLLAQTSLDDASLFTVHKFLKDVLPDAQSRSFIPWTKDHFDEDTAIIDGEYIPSASELSLFAEGLRQAKFTVNDIGGRSSITTISAPVYDEETLLGVLHVAHAAARGEEDLDETHVDSMGLVAKLLGKIPEKIRTEEAAAEERYLRGELLKATEMQEELLQPITPDMWEGYTMSGEWLSGTLQGGGDGYFLHELPEGKKFFAHFDVSGHGAKCIPIQVAMMAVLHERARAGELDPDLKVLTESFNASLQELIPNSYMFATAILGYITPGESEGDEETEDTVSIYHAGHEPAMVIEKDGTVRKEIDLEKGGLPLVMDIPMSADAGVHSFPLRSGDTLVLTTDGTSEVQNAHDEQLQSSGVAAFLRAYEGPKGEMAQALHAYVAEYAKGSKQGVFDDTTTLTITKD